MLKQFYTIQEVAEMLQFSDQTIRDWVRTGRIKAARPGLRAWRIPRAEVERLMAQFDMDGSALENSADIRTPGHAEPSLVTA